MIGIKRSLMMLAAGAALAVSGSVGSSAAPSASPATVIAPGGASAQNGLTLVDRHWNGRGRWDGHRHGHFSSFWWGAPLLAAPFLYDGYYNGYGDYGYRYGGGNSCYRACRYDHGPRYCRYHWERYC